MSVFILNARLKFYTVKTTNLLNVNKERSSYPYSLQ